MDEQTPVLAKHDLIPDAALTTADGDSLDHAPVARVVGDLARAVDTKSNIALFGPWGSGKSSIYAMMKADIEKADPAIAVVDYDAWKFGGNSLHRNFLMHLAARLNVSPDRYLSNLHSGSESTRLRLGTFLLRNKASLLIAFIVAVAAGAAWLSVSAWATSYFGELTFKEQLIKGAPSAAVIFGVVIAGLLLSNQSLASAVEKRTRSPLQDADQFSTAFDTLMEFVTRPKRFWRIGHRQIDKLVVFIDELDRCSPEDVVTTLIDLKTFLHHNKCVFIVAADRDVLERALEEAPQAKPVRDNEPYYSTAGAFLDKIFQHQMSLPPTRPEALTNFAMSLANKQGGLWKTLRADTRRYEDVVYSLVPAHVQSPRRVKVLMNNFATNARVIESRDMPWEERAVEIAVLTVLETEFPAVVRDLIHQPRLLDELVTDDEPASTELERLRAVYNPNARVANHPQTDNDEGPTGPLLVDDEEKPSQVSRAQLKLNQQLDAYLSKVHAAGIAFPSPDLIYLQNAGHAQGLIDTDLAKALDFAADTDPDQLVDAFTDASASDRKAAVVFLGTKANTTFGSGRANIIESCCRIAERLGTADISSIAGQVASTVLGEVPKGRWRDQATPGAILLGLFDPTIADPIARLGDRADGQTLAASGFLARITPVLPGLNDNRASEVHDLLGEAYETEPSPMHEALRDLPTAAATRLWNAQQDTIASVIASLPDEIVPPPAAPSAAPQRTSTAGLPRRAVEVSEDPETPADREAAESAPDRYDALLAAIESRTEAANEVGDHALQLGLTRDRPALYATAHAYAASFRQTVIDDPDVFNRRILDTIPQTSTARLFDAERPDIQFWLDLLDTTRPLGDAADAAAETITDAVRDIDADRAHTLPSLLAPLVPHLTEPTIDGMLTYIDSVLATVPFADSQADVETEPTEKRRDACYALLTTLSPVTAPETEDRLRRADLERAITTETLDQATIAGIMGHLVHLSATAAAELDTYIGTLKTPEDAHLARTRIRTRARKHAAKSPLPVATFLKALTDDVASTTVIEEWLATQPPASEVLKTLHRTAPTARCLDTYASTKNIADRSKLWLELRKQNYLHNHLHAVGKHGVNATVPSSMRDSIIGADLSTQRSLVSTLLTANLGLDSGAKLEATRISIALLTSGLSGSGQSAALITLNAGGSAQGQTQNLRNAYDAFTTNHPKAINKTDLRSLDALKLLTKRKKSPMVKALGWAFG